MPILQILSEVQQKKFDSCPKLTAKQKESYFFIDEQINFYIDKMRDPNNQVGFLVQLAYFRASGKFFTNSSFRNIDLKFACDILGLDFKSFSKNFNYSYKCRSLHKNYILEHSGWKNFSKVRETELKEVLSKHVKQQLYPKQLLPLATQYLISNKIELPQYYALTKIITEVYNVEETKLVNILEMALTSNQKTILDNLIWIEDKRKKSYKYSALSKIKQFSYSIKIQDIEESIKNYQLLKAFYTEFAIVYQTLELRPSATNYYSEWVRRSKLFQLKQFKNRSKAHLYLLAHIKHQYFRQTDLYIEILLKLVNNAANSMSKKIEQHNLNTIRQQQKIIELLSNKEQGHTQALQEILGVLDDPKKNYQARVVDARQLILNKLEKEPSDTANKLSLQILDAALIKQDLKVKLLKHMGASLQRRLTPIICSIDFNIQESRFKNLMQKFISSGGKIVKNYIQEYLSMEREGLSNVPDFQDAIVCKAILFNKLYNFIKDGRVSACYSYNYLSIDKYFINETTWKEHSKLLLETNSLDKFSSFEEVINSLQEVITNKYKQVNYEYINGNNKYLSFDKEGKFIIATPKKETVKNKSKLTKIFTQEGIIPIAQVLANINTATSFIKCFKHHALKSVKIKPSVEAIYAGIISKGCNHGTQKMANISKGINKTSFASTLNWFFDLDNIQAANNTIIEHINKLALPDIYKLSNNYSHTSSDGQKFNVGVDSILANYSFKYFGQAQGISAYTFIDDRQVLFHSTVLSPGTREATFVIDGIMANNVVKSFMHSTDTHGYSEAIFAVMHFLGVSFAPRIKKLGTQHLYCIDPKRAYHKQDYKIKPNKKINIKLIFDNWDNILKLIATIKTKTTTASQIFSRLNSYTKEPILYKALKEFGRIIKTAYILTYINDALLRQQIEKQLNRIEASNKFARAVFFANSQEFRIGSIEEQKVIVACRVFIQNCIVLWNYLYLSQVLISQTKENQHHLIKLIKTGSVISWRHINLHGTYDFSAANDNSISTPIFDLDKIQNLKIA